jgi:hypothetical protein
MKAHKDAGMYRGSLVGKAVILVTGINPNENDQGRKGPCCFQRLKGVKKSKKYLILL